VGKVGVLPMLHGPGQGGFSTLGGWNFMVSAYSKPTNEAWQLVQEMISPAAQQQRALVTGHGRL
jgi:ABC-type glycerol-3-phosphate transport system substrate-binding protein